MSILVQLLYFDHEQPLMEHDGAKYLMKIRNVDANKDFSFIPKKSKVQRSVSNEEWPSIVMGTKPHEADTVSQNFGKRWVLVD